jgi:ketosteroid isomerase-like protein
MTDQTALDRLFNGLAQGDLDESRAALAPDARVWHSFDGIAHDRDAILASFADIIAAFPERRFGDIRRQPTPTGYVQQHVMAVKTADGRAMAWPVCVVVRIEAGMIVRLDEYIDRAGSYVPGDGPLLTPGF